MYKKNNHLNKIFYTVVFAVFLLFSNINFVFAQLLSPEDVNQQDNAFLESSGFDGSSTIGSIMATVIKAFLGLLGIIFIFLMVLAGYHWMTAAGDEQKVTKAKDTIRTAIIGLIIIVAAYSITYFVFQALGSATS